VALIGVFDTLALTTADKKGAYVFRDVPSGYYEVCAWSGDWFVAAERVHVGRHLEQVEHLRMVRGGAILSWFRDVARDTTIAFTDLERDGALRLEIDLRSSIVAIGSGTLLSVEPAYLGDIVQSAYDAYELAIEAPADVVFQTDSLALTIGATLAGSNRMDSVRLVYAVDTVGFDSLMTARMIHEWEPRNGAKGVDRERAIHMRFAQRMDRPSVENSISLQPAANLEFFWSDRELSVVPANSLDASTTVTLTIDTTAMTHDSVRFRVPIRLSFTTNDPDFFRDHWPLHAAENAPPEAPFFFESVYTLDSSLFVAAFSIQPEPDSLTFSPANEHRIRVHHGTLLPDTTYTITIDGSLSTRKGTLLGSDKKIVFHTGSNGRSR
jgi:hypothetical protein